ncbi:MAG: UDP-N-acetylmuramoyl-L-alanyl-D-glutamate--2,6-diaminopimelate ligase [Victivallaceae bacterium]|nr:UDP-N-acetylmuramoyl-L-alanyl-D-glutamate--2,6-diaminopimelate ligase [Victivallaceae bacterium]
MKTINDYVNHLTGLLRGRTVPENGVVSRVTCDSRQVRTGSLFCAIKGSLSDGHDFIKAAVSKGAAAVVHSQDLDEYATGISYLKVREPYLAYAMACELFFDCPAERLRLHGITGTNGKTTIAFLLEHVLTASGLKTGLISTVECRDGGKVIPSAHTTPEASELQELFRRIADNNCSDAVMEVSSHGLYQFRPGSAKFHTAVFTNLTGDHLDYHGDMERYFAAKKNLFSHYLAADGNAVINIDDECGKILAAGFRDKNVTAYGRGRDADCRIVNLKTGTSGTDFTIEFRGRRFRISSPLIGEYNAYNNCAAFAAAALSGVDGDSAADILSREIKVPGRLERFRDLRGVTYFVDYAHTDDALRNVLKNLRIIAPARIITVFGCGGNRDRSKRPRMAAAAAEYSDLLIITSDNPRREDPMAIISEIQAGIPAGTEFYIEPDREEAIRSASEAAGEGDIVLVAGKGHEMYQDINGRLFDFDDRKIIMSICAS